MTRSRFAVAALALLGTALATTSAFAANRFAVVSVANKTQANMTFSYIWGSGSWEQTSLAPGQTRTFWYQYPTANQNSSPFFNVRYDSDAKSGKYIQKYNLKKNACSENSFSCSMKYVFKYDSPSRKFIELYKSAN